MEDMKFTYKVSELKPHPMNAELFDDIDDGKWDEFLESIHTYGVIEPLIVTQDKVIVSGHQRVRACKELGIDEVDCIVKYYDSDDDVLRDLIETNIRQRGEVGGTAQKVGKRIKELERIYGVSHGRVKEATMVSQKDIADEFGMSETSLKRYKRFADMIPELAEAVDSGVVTQTTALAMISQLSEEEQEELISQLDVTKKYTQKEIDEKLAEYKKPEVQVVEREPADYQKNKADLAKAENTIDGMKKDFNRLRSDLNERTAERNQYRDQVKSMKEADQKEQVQKRRIDTGAMFNSRVTKFIEDVAGYIWLTDEIMELPDGDRAAFKRSVQKVKDWATQMQYNISEKEKEK